MVYFVTLMCLVSCVKLVSAISWDPECGKSKGCFPNCPDGCNYLVTWEPLPIDGVRFTITANMPHHLQTEFALAVGFSKDWRMGDDGGIFCTYNYNYEVYLFHNTGLHSEWIWGINSVITNMSTREDNGVFSCSFLRTYAALADSRLFDVHHHYVIMLVFLEGDQKWYFSENSRPMNHYCIPWMSENEVSLLSTDIVDEYKLNTSLVKLHGIMMVSAWLLFSTVGIFTARYYKFLKPGYTIRGERPWFQIHRCMMLLVMGCVSVGVIAIFVNNRGYSQVPLTKNKTLARWHPVIGLVVIVLCFVNTFMALFRPHNEHRHRWNFNWIHFAIGLITQTLAVTTLLFGYYLERAQVKHAVYVTVAHITINIIFYGFMEVITKLRHKGDIKRSTKTTENKAESGDVNMKWSTIGMTLYFMMSVGLTITSIIMIARSGSNNSTYSY